MKLSNRAVELLSLISEKTYMGKDGFQRYFVPFPYDSVHGAGDANCLRGLERKGLIKRMPIGDYSYAITEEGVIMLEALKGEAG